MLVKLAFVMQRLKNIWKIFVMINKDGGDNFSIFFWGGHRAHGGPPSPPTRENPDFTLTDALVTIQTINLSVPGLELKKEMNGRGRHLEQEIWFLTINQVQPTLFL